MTKRFLAVSALLTWLLGLLPGSAALAARPEAVGWWNRTNVGAPVAPPAPPDVPPGGLYVEGVGGGGPVTPPPPGAAPAPDTADSVFRAIAALRFGVPAGAIPTTLTLQAAGSPSPDATVLACAAPAGFAPVENGPWDDRPAYDCTTSATATVGEDGSLSFTNVDALVRAGSLQVVLLPAGAVRIAIEPPGDDALAVTTSAGGSTGPSAGAAGSSSSSGAPMSAAPGDATVDAPATGAPSAPEAAATDTTLPAVPADDPPAVQPTAPASTAASAFPTGPAFGTLFVVAVAAVLLWKIPSRYPVVVRQAATGRATPV